MVWLGEALNTALELLADEVSLEQRPLIGKAKDVAAAGVLIASLASLAVAGVILLRHL
jgi:diacylglycerol kinase (ATP)